MATTFFLWIAVAVMCASIVSFCKSKKMIQEILKQENVEHRGIVRGYLALLIFFQIAYVIYICVGKRATGSFGILVPSILFLGSIFVYITMFFLQTIINDLIKAKMNQLDSLTGLLNKEAFKNSVEKELLDHKVSHALLVIDLDNFKEINDNYGHMEGDEIIINVAKIIRNEISTEDLAGRFGGDEFVAMLKNCSMEEAKNTAQTINESICRYCRTQKAYLRFGASVGVSYQEAEKVISYDDLFMQADNAMYKSKQNGKNCVTIITK